MFRIRLHNSWLKSNAVNISYSMNLTLTNRTFPRHALLMVANWNQHEDMTLSKGLKVFVEGLSLTITSCVIKER
jgi:hypothetical protein